jgi:hypothetical protein
MPRIFDNIENILPPALTKALGVSHRADFCFGCFNLRYWKDFIMDEIEKEKCCIG